jgi:hypothetical protein
MHPGFYAWWSGRRGPGFAACGHHAAAHHEWHRGAWGTEGGPFAHGAAGFEHDPSAAFGVRRPLRFLAHKLELDENQVATLAAVLDELKTERAQAAVNARRRISALAEAIEGADLDEAKLQRAGDVQTESAEAVRAAVANALRKLHAVLDDAQRKKLAMLLRSGMLSL